jgi:hypothetical protein
MAQKKKVPVKKKAVKKNSSANKKASKKKSRKRFEDGEVDPSNKEVNKVRYLLDEDDEDLGDDVFIEDW